MDKFIGKWEIAGTKTNGIIIDFEQQCNKELKNINYNDLKASDPELCQTLEIFSGGRVKFITSENEALEGNISTDEQRKTFITIDTETMPLSYENGYLVFDIEGGYIFKRA